MPTGDLLDSGARGSVYRTNETFTRARKIFSEWHVAFVDGRRQWSRRDVLRGEEGADGGQMDGDALRGEVRQVAEDFSHLPGQLLVARQNMDQSGQAQVHRGDQGARVAVRYGEAVV